MSKKVNFRTAQKYKCISILQNTVSQPLILVQSFSFGVTIQGS